MHASLLRSVFDCTGHEYKEWNLKTFIVDSLLSLDAPFIFQFPVSVFVSGSPFRKTDKSGTVTDSDLSDKHFAIQMMVLNELT